MSSYLPVIFPMLHRAYSISCSSNPSLSFWVFQAMGSNNAGVTFVDGRSSGSLERSSREGNEGVRFSAGG